MRNINSIYNLCLTILRSNLLKNFSLVSLFQLINFLVPLLVTPYLVSRIGIENFGKSTYVLGIMAFLSVIIEYGFNITTTKEISINRNNKVSLSIIYTNTVISKGLLFIFVLFFLLAYILFYNTCGHATENNLYFFSISYIIGQALLPQWIFQGLEKMVTVSIVNAFSKLLYIALVFTIIKKAEDYIIVNLLLGLSMVLNAIVLNIILYVKHEIKIVKTSYSNVINSLSESWNTFISSASINLYYGGANIFILSLFANPTIIGYYGIAEKVIIVIRQPISIFIQVVYPKACIKVSKRYKFATQYIVRVIKPFFLFTFIISCCIFLLAPQISLFFMHKENTYVTSLIKLGSILPFSVGFNVPSYILLLAYGYSKGVSKIIVLSALGGVVLNIILSRNMLAYGTVLSMICTEAVIALGLYIFAKKKDLY